MRYSRRRTRLMAVWAATAFTVTAGAAVFVAAPARAASAYCGQVWGSAAKQAPGHGANGVADVRAGQHPCYDRLVIDLDQAAGYRVGYVPSVLTQGKGAPVSLRGAAFLEVTVYATASTPANPADVANVTGFRTFRQVAFAGSFEGYTSLGLGVRAKLPFRVFELVSPNQPSRLVVDVGHQW